MGVAATLVSSPYAPPTLSITKAPAVGASSALSSSGRNHFGIKNVRTGISARMMMGNPIAAMVWVIANVAPKPNSWIAMKAQTARRRSSRESGSAELVSRRSRARKSSFCVIPLPVRACVPMTKKRPASTPCGIKCNTTSSGPVMVPRVRRPWARLLTRCSTTWSTIRVVLPLFVSSVSASWRVTQRELVWNGACGMRPLGNGIPRRPATPVVRPRRKMSQWKPGGLRRGNSLPWAIRDDTVAQISGQRGA